MENNETSLDEYQEKLNKINEYYTKLFEGTNEEDSIEYEINSFYEELFKDNEEDKSIHSKITELLQTAKKEYQTFTAQKTQISSFHKKLFEETDDEYNVEEMIDNFYDKIFKDEDDNPSYNTKFSNLFKSLEDRFNSTESKFKKLETFYRDVYEDQKNDDGSVKKLSLINTLNSQQKRLETLINEATQKLYALTDSSLHNAFAKRADEYTKEFRRLENITHSLVWAIIADVFIFGIIQAFSEKFNYHLLIYQFSIAGSLIFAIWMYNRNQKIAKKLAEEYHHKAAIAEAMTGYRHLYDLEHADTEYMELFNSLKEQLNVNPSKSIDKFLNLKSPQEEVTETLKKTPDAIQKIAEAVKPMLNITKPIIEN